MGGIGSGKTGGRPTVEQSLTLDVSTLMRGGLLKDQGRSAGTLYWNRGTSQTASMQFAATLHEDRGGLLLFYSSTDNQTGEHRKHERTINLEATPQPFGGRRWWFVCPSTGKRVRKLHIPPGRSAFASREAYRLGYATQRQSPRDRSTTRAFRLRRRLGDTTGGVGDYVAKPKWMRTATYARELERIWAADDACEVFLMDAFARLFGNRLEARLGEGA